MSEVECLGYGKSEASSASRRLISFPLCQFALEGRAMLCSFVYLRARAAQDTDEESDWKSVRRSSALHHFRAWRDGVRCIVRKIWQT